MATDRIEPGILRPRRGKRSTAIARGLILKRGEVFFEIPDTGVGTGAGKIVMGDGSTAYKDLPYYSEGGGGGEGTVKSVNYVTPDESGNITLSQIPYAENLLDPENIEQTDAYIFRTSGGSLDISSGNASLDRIKGNCTIDSGVITVAKPTTFRSIGLNQFDKASAILKDYTISNSGAITASTGNYVCYIHAVGGLDNGYIAYDPNSSITRIGWYASIPTPTTTGITIAIDGIKVTELTNDNTTSLITNTYDGYICIACNNIDKLCVHPRWTGLEDSKSEPYSESIINIPTVDASSVALPTGSYGFPAIDDTRDEINFAQRTYTQRIGYYPYTANNLIIVQAMDVPYIYDTRYIFYVLKNPKTYTLASDISSNYIVSDYGTEEFLGTSLPIYATTVYGDNLRDKLRHNVVTLSKQETSYNQKKQARENIDAAQNHLEFTEAADMSNHKLLNTIVSGNPMDVLVGASKRLMRRFDSQIAGKVASVNTIKPDHNGNVELTRVPLADNLYSPDNNEEFAQYTYRSSGGMSDVSTGEAQLSFIRGNMSAKGRTEEYLEYFYSSSYTPSSGESYTYPTVQVDEDIWKASDIAAESGTYVFTFDGTNWSYDSTVKELSTYGITVSGTTKENDTITIIYTKENHGILCTINPSKFVATGINQFDPSSMILEGYTIDNTGLITELSDSYVAFVKAPYSDDDGYVIYDQNSSIVQVGFINEIPEGGKTVDLTGQELSSSLSIYYVPEESINANTGYICVACTDTSKLCIHPRWSGGNDTTYEAYNASIINIPTTDSNGNDLPHTIYGLPSIGSIADEINFDLKQYIVRIGYYPFSNENLEVVKEMEVDYDYDDTAIFYVLPRPVTVSLADTVSSVYKVDDYGTEHFDYTIGLGEEDNLLISADHLYGQNLRDKLRRDVLTKSAQVLTTAEKTQVLSNLGAASTEYVDQVTGNISNIGNVNLIRNPWFTINTKGKSSYSTANECLDMWSCYSTDVNYQNITLGNVVLIGQPNDIYQTISYNDVEIKNEPYTLSAIIDGQLYKYTCTPYADGESHELTSEPLVDGIKLWLYEHAYNLDEFIFAINVHDCTSPHVIKAVKLEKGSGSTLLNDNIPNYYDELCKCGIVDRNIGEVAKYSVKNLLLYYAETTNYPGVNITASQSGTININGVPDSDELYYIGHITIPGEYIISDGDIKRDDIYLYMDCTLDGDYVSDIPGSETNSGEKYIKLDFNGYDDVRVACKLFTGSTYDNINVYPMIREAYIRDNTYASPAYMNKDLLSHADNGIIGARNLLRSIPGTTQIDNVIFTINKDGSITLSSTGTVDNPIDFHIEGFDGYIASTEYSYKAGNIIRSTGISIPDAYLYLSCADGDSGQNNIDIREEQIIPKKDYYSSLTLHIPANVDLSSPAIVYPMILLASDTIKEYQSPTLTNAEITDTINNKVDQAQVRLIDNNRIQTNSYNTTTGVRMLSSGNTSDSTSSIYIQGARTSEDESTYHDILMWSYDGNKFWADVQKDDTNNKSIEISAANIKVDYIEDADDISSYMIDRFNWAMWNDDTLGTPYKTSQTTSTGGCMITCVYDNDYAYQLCMPAGEGPWFYRGYASVDVGGDGWSDWKQVDDSTKVDDMYERTLGILGTIPAVDLSQETWLNKSLNSQYWDEDTLNTPYKASLTTGTSGMVTTSYLKDDSDNEYIHQIASVNGSTQLFIRSYDGSNWSNWSSVVTGSVSGTTLTLTL